ncbi:hypothetical protein CDD83_2708 [Cordyceps sp. RAO-2017]|nr:hypothetical protein CDD83_2708 [Cordyceps sp. RAO-2017]
MSPIPADSHVMQPLVDAAARPPPRDGMPQDSLVQAGIGACASAGVRGQGLPLERAPTGECERASERAREGDGKGEGERGKKKELEQKKKKKDLAGKTYLIVRARDSRDPPLASSPHWSVPQLMSSMPEAAANHRLTPISSPSLPSRPEAGQWAGQAAARCRVRHASESTGPNPRPRSAAWQGGGPPAASIGPRRIRLTFPTV